FIQKLTEEQKSRLLHAAKGEGRDQPAAATPIRILIASFRIPPWSDRAPAPAPNTYISHGHPFHTTSIYPAVTGATPGGGWSNGQRVGLNAPAWNEQHRGHDDPVGGADSFVYRLRTDFVERWFTFMFDYSNVNSVANFYRANSHGNIAIQGDRSDIAAWLDSHHILDNNNYGSNRDWTPMPASPIIREISPAASYMYRTSVETGQFSVLFRDHFVAGRTNLNNYRIDLPAGTAPDTPPYTPTAGTAQQDGYDDRHVTFTGVTWSYWNTGATPPAWATKTVSNDTAYTLTFVPTGDTSSGTVGRGCAGLPNTTMTQAEADAADGLLKTNPFNRFLSLCYYTHDHDFTTKSERPYQLSGVFNSRGYRDDIMGTVQTDLNYHIDRPRPYDHDFWDDANLFTGGYFSSTPGHNFGSWEAACDLVMADWGISSAGYQRVIYVQPAGTAVPAGSRFIPNSSVLLPEDAGLGVTGHELGHTFGMGDLYDKDFYANNGSPPPSPPYFESDATGPYSVMANDGLRVDPFHKIALGWVAPTTLETAPGSGVPKDRVAASIPEIEGNLQNPIVYKAVPDWATGNLTGGLEYFLIENRNRNFGNYFGDMSPRGLYVWHIDMRPPFNQHNDEVYFSVITEQADGLFELERNPRGVHGNMESDPFPGSLGIRTFTQFGTVNTAGTKRAAPNTRSHGTPASRGVIVPGSSYDTFFRVDNISDAGANMTADIWVQPHELIVTANQIAPETALQGDLNVPVLGLHLQNTGVAPNISTGDVVIRDVLIDESGSSKNDADTVRALLYEDVNGNGTVQPGTDVLLGTAPVVNQQANITGLSFRVAAAAADRDLLLCYDIANNAQPWNTLGAGIDYPEPNIDPNYPRSAITCQIPGVIQERQRTGVGTWGFSRFPIRTEPGTAPPQTYKKTTILEAPDTLTITPTNLAPATAIQGTLNVPMLGMRLRVNRDEVILDALKIDSMGTSTRPGDVLAKLYYDQNINNIIDPADTVLDTATFSMVGGIPTAVFDDLKDYTVVEGTDRGLIVAYDVATDAGDPPAVPPVTVNGRLLDPTYVTLRQTSPPPSAQDTVAATNFLAPPTGMRSTDTLILINTAPTLVDHLGGTTDWVIPQDGWPTTNFRWEALYTDAENQPPAVLQVWLDGVAYNMAPVSPGDTNYVDGAQFFYQTTLPVGNHVYYIVCSDGKTQLRFPTTAPDTFPHPVVTNPAPTLTMVPGETDYWSPKQTTPPYDGTPRTTFTWRVIYTDAESEPPNPIQVWIDGVMRPMAPSNPADTDYTDGAEFFYATTLAVGLHSYYLYTSDGTNAVRIPTTPPNTLTGPDVYDPPCTLTDSLGGTVAWLTPTTGTPQTNFIWTAIYTDPESIPPTAIQVWIDGVARNMAQTDPADNNYADGAEFRYQTTLPVGNHSYYMWANDGNNTVRFPTTPPNTYPFPVVTDQPCTLKDKNGGTAAWLTPEDGTTRTRFEWLATYTDPENQPPSSIVVTLDGTARNMVKVNPADNDYRDGAQYRLRLFLPVGSHSYFISCSDGNNPLRYPGAGTYPHPVVTDPPCTLTDNAGGTTDWLSPTTGTPRTTFVWEAIYTDPESVPPTVVEVWIDGTAQAMTQVNPADNDYSDGALFRYQTTLAIGTHSYYMHTNDGNTDVRFPTTAPNTYAAPTVTDPPCTLTDKRGGATAWLNPGSGSPYTTFTWTAIYTDPEGIAPTAVQVWLNGVAQDMTQTDPTDLNYADGAEFIYQTTLPIGTHSYYMWADDGVNTIRVPVAPATYKRPVVTDAACTLVDKNGSVTDWVTPQDGGPATNFIWEATYTDPENQPPASLDVNLDGTAYPMVPVNPADTDYTDGAVFRYQTTLPVGAHSYFMSCTDGNNPLRYPTTAPDTYPHPVVTDLPCSLADKNGGTSIWVTPNKGNTKTVFLWTAVYTDPESVAPNPIQVVLDGTPQAMTPVDPTDQNYADGATFTYQTTLAVGTHSFYMFASDGNNTVRYPATGAYAKPIVTDPILTLIDRFGGTSAWLTPVSGTPTTTFTWEAIYTDTKNNPPTAIQIWLDGVAYAMAQVNPADVDYTDGALFRYRSSGLAVATHSYYIYATDGTEVARHPGAPNTYPQPVVNNTAPQLLNAAVNPQAGTETDAFLYTITFRDADGHLPTYVRIKTDNGTWVDMTLSGTEPTPGNTIDGDIYEYQTGFIGAGTHTARFVASDGFEVVYYPATGDFMGPFIQTDSSGFWADSSYNPFAGPYEEGEKVYCVIQDGDENKDLNARDTLDVTVTVVNGGDTETVTLLETGPNTGIFRTWPDGVPTLGRAGASGDGVINVVAGPTGNTLRLNYTDPDDPSGNDTTTDTIGVIDTKAPVIVKLVELTAAPDPDGNVVTVDWTAYDEASQIDVARYSVYYESAPAPITTLTPVASPLAGTQTVQINTGGPDGDKYVAVAVSDEVPNRDANVKWRKVSTADTNPPVMIGESPTNGSTDVPLDTDILFRIEDPGSGVQTSDIRVRIQQAPADGGGWTDVSAALQFSGTTKAWNVTYDPPIDLLYNQQVTVEVRATDLFGNTLTTTFSFFTETDVNAPQLQNAQPADGDTNVPIDTNISFELTDDHSGVDPASIHVTVNGTNVSGALQIGGTPALTTVLYNPPADFDWGETVTVTVDASDVAGNAMSTVQYSFTTLPDVSSTVIDQLTPADQATNVPVDTPIAFRVSDNISGVDVASVELFIDNAPITLTGANFKQLSPTSYMVTYDPPTNFANGQSVKVRATAKDLAGNPRTGKTWHFRTEPPPTYSITGTIEETVTNGTTASKVGVPGVRVKIIDFATGALVKTVISVGTGVFEATGLLDGTYVVEPTLTDYTFISRKTGKPSERVYVGLKDKDGDGNPELDASGVDFDATRTLYAIEGRVLEGSQGLQGVTITDGTRTAITDVDGRYRLDNVASGSYTITPSLTNYTFNPASRVAVVASANATGIDFTATARTFSISGTIQDPAGNRLSGVKVEVQGGTSVAVTNQAGQYTLTGVKAGQRTIVASRDGYIFEPAPGVTAANLIVDRDFTGIDFIGYPVLTRTFTAGRHFVGVPATPRDNDPVVVFGTTQVARWVGTESPPRYVTADSDPGHDALQVIPGRGFFVKYPARTTIQVAGTPVPITDPYVFVIDEGWTMAANPFPSALGFANLVPSAAGAMAPYGFVLEGGRYAIVSDIAALGGRRWIEAWEGVWLLSDAPALTITALPPGAAPAAVAPDAPARVANRGNWRIPIVAAAAGTTDACTAVGVSAATGALAVPNPPSLPGVVDVVLQGADGRSLAFDLKGRAAKELTWTFSVMGAAPSTDVELALPDLSEVPEDLTITLVDVAAGKRLYARTMPSYVYPSGDGAPREFRLEVKPRTAAGLTIRTTGVQVRPNLAAVSYTVAADAEITAEVLNVAGRPIRTLTRGSSVAAGANTLNWDLKSEAQTRVPAGRYLVRIEAATPDGQRASALQTVFVNR
ncbi:MAG: hypothetical protein FJX75_08065, partial [Armatimonadetes bacterium]|nr:hypothetical protein [Armatimonadota bacterium]